MFRGESLGTDGDIIALPSNHIAQILYCRSDLRRQKSFAELECRGDRNGDRLGFLLKEALSEPSGGEFKRELVVE